MGIGRQFSLLMQARIEGIGRVIAGGLLPIGLEGFPQAIHHIRGITFNAQLAAYIKGTAVNIHGAHLALGTIN